MPLFAILTFCTVYTTANPVNYLLAPEETMLSVSRPSVEILKQVHQVNDHGSYTFGYVNSDGSFRAEHKDVYGYVMGTFGYIDANGQLQTSEYIAGRDSIGRSLGFKSKQMLTAALIPAMGPISSESTVKVIKNNQGLVSQRYTALNNRAHTEARIKEVPEIKVKKEVNSAFEQPKFFRFGQALFRSSSTVTAKIDSNG